MTLKEYCDKLLCASNWLSTVSENERWLKTAAQERITEELLARIDQHYVECNNALKDLGIDSNLRRGV